MWYSQSPVQRLGVYGTPFSENEVLTSLHGMPDWDTSLCPKHRAHVYTLFELNYDLQSLGTNSDQERQKPPRTSTLTQARHQA